VAVIDKDSSGAREPHNPHSKWTCSSQGRWAACIVSPEKQPHFQSLQTSPCSPSSQPLAAQAPTCWTRSCGGSHFFSRSLVFDLIMFNDPSAVVRPMDVASEPKIMAKIVVALKCEDDMTVGNAAMCCLELSKEGASVSKSESTNRQDRAWTSFDSRDASPPSSMPFTTRRIKRKGTQRLL
jgi:hypothetical protein